MKKLLFLSATLLLFSSTACKKLFPFKKTVIKIEPPRDTVIFKDLSFKYYNQANNVFDKSNNLYVNTGYKVEFSYETEGKKEIDENYVLNVEDISKYPQDKKQEEIYIRLLKADYTIENPEISRGNYPILSSKNFRLNTTDKTLEYRLLATIFDKRNPGKSLFVKEFGFAVKNQEAKEFRVQQVDEILLSNVTKAGYANREFSKIQVLDENSSALYDLKISVFKKKESFGTETEELAENDVFSLSINGKPLKYNDFNGLELIANQDHKIVISFTDKNHFLKSQGEYIIKYELRRLSDRKIFNASKPFKITDDDFNFELKNTSRFKAFLGLQQVIILYFPEGSRGVNTITEFKLEGVKANLYQISNSSGIDTSITKNSDLYQGYLNYVNLDYNTQFPRPISKTISNNGLNNPNTPITSQRKNGTRVAIFFVEMLEVGTTTLSIKVKNIEQNIEKTKTIQIRGEKEEYRVNITPTYSRLRNYYIKDYDDEIKFDVNIERSYSEKAYGVSNFAYKLFLENFTTPFNFSSNNGAIYTKIKPYYDKDTKLKFVIEDNTPNPNVNTLKEFAFAKTIKKNISNIRYTNYKDVTGGVIFKYDNLNKKEIGGGYGNIFYSVYNAYKNKNATITFRNDGENGFIRYQVENGSLETRYTYDKREETITIIIPYSGKEYTTVRIYDEVDDKNPIWAASMRTNYAYGVDIMISVDRGEDGDDINYRYWEENKGEGYCPNDLRPCLPNTPPKR